MPNRQQARAIAITLTLLASSASAQGGERLKTLRVLSDDYPRAFFFRASEGLAANPRVSYEQWEQTFSRLMGIEGKVLDEEVPGRSRRNIEFFTRFKHRHPEQLVLLHFNGNARDPRDAGPGYFAGHWVYYNGATILEDVPAEQGETDIRVSDTDLFKTGIGRYRDKNEDIGLCELDADGRPNWSAAEQVRLVGVDPGRKTIRVRRGCYGTAPRAFRAKRAYAAAHVTEGPWGKRSHLMWYYNFATTCPRDAAGRQAADVLVDELGRWFGQGGKLAAFDGLEFDVMHHAPFGMRRRPRPRGADVNADGKVDEGAIDGINVTGVGVVAFCATLRERFGDDRLILADGTTTHSQRAMGILNGIESEGWPRLNDWDIRDWSGGLNRHGYWRAFGRPPVFNYINHKFTTHGPTPGSRRRPDVPFSTHRLVLAVAQFTDSAVCYSFMPPREPGQRIGVWDEFWMGVEHKLGWLGKPVGPAVRLAERAPDRLDGAGRNDLSKLTDRITGEGVRVDLRAGRLRIAPGPDASGPVKFRFSDVPCHGPDLFIRLTLRGEPRPRRPETMPRLAWVGIAPDPSVLVRPELPPGRFAFRGQDERDLDHETGAVVRFFRKRTFGDESHDAYLVHPPYRGGKGYTVWSRDVTVPDNGRLEFVLGMGERAPSRSDGVTFRVAVAPLTGEKPGKPKTVFEHTQVASTWTRHTVPLKAWSGRRVRLRFVSDCGPKDNATTDHSYWGDVVVVDPARQRPPTEPVKYMTWVGPKPFTSTFAFGEVTSDRVDLEFEIEGAAPVDLIEISAHAHPDAIYREYERGVVLANPSDRPYVFDLARLLPGRRLARIRGSSRQDPETNDGSPVGDQVKLGPVDGLFVRKVK